MQTKWMFRKHISAALPSTRQPNHTLKTSALSKSAAPPPVPGAGGLSSSSCQFMLLSAQGPPPIGANTISADVQQPGAATATVPQPAHLFPVGRNYMLPPRSFESLGVWNPYTLILQHSWHMGTSRADPWKSRNTAHVSFQLPR